MMNCRSRPVDADKNGFMKSVDAPQKFVEDATTGRGGGAPPAPPQDDTETTADISWSEDLDAADWKDQSMGKIVVNHKDVINGRGKMTFHHRK
jgi:hypothetical protein